MNHKNVYMKIIFKAKSENRKKYKGVYYEKHHILPKSLFPLWKNRRSNLVLLTAREHFICHQLLSKIYPGQSMFLALWRLANDGQNNYIIKGSREYEKLKIQFSQFTSQFFKGHKYNLGRKQSQEEINKRVESRKGYKHSEETKEKIGLANIEVFKNNPQICINRGKKYSEWCKNNPDKIIEKNEKYSEWYNSHPDEVTAKNEKYSEWCKNNPDKKSNAGKKGVETYGEGYGKWNKGKKRTPEQAKRNGDFARGKHWFTDGNKDVLEFECPEGFIKGRTKMNKHKA